MRYYTLKDLLQALEEAGLPHSKKTIINWEKQGKLVFKHTTHTQPSHARRVMFDTDIEEIIKSFKPGGKGYWKCKE